MVFPNKQDNEMFLPEVKKSHKDKQPMTFPELTFVAIAVITPWVVWASLMLYTIIIK